MHHFSNWRPSGGELFRGEISAGEHMMQIYEEDSALLDSPEAFVRSGVQRGEGVIVIATGDHLRALHDRLKFYGLDLAATIARDQYIPVDVDEILPEITVHGWPDEEVFVRRVTELLVRARGRLRWRRVRVFGELVSVMWALGNRDATHRLELIWHRLCATESFPLFCAYPRARFVAKGADARVQAICAAHSTVIT